MAIFTPVIELLLDGVWTDITADVRLADGINITRGRADEADVIDPATVTLTLNNRAGKYSARNPVGLYYGKIGRNVTIRITVSASSRFYGEVSAWPQRWDKTGRDVYTPIQAYGILRRLSQGQSALKSTIYRALTTRANVQAYWPCEDAEGATRFASALPGHSPMKQHGPVQMASFEGFVASSPLPLASNVTWQGAIPPYTLTGETQVNFLMAVPAGGVSATAGVCYLRTTGTAQTWKLTLSTTGGLRLQAFDAADTQIVDSGFIAFACNGKLLRVSVELDDSGSGVDWAVATLEAGNPTGLATSGSLASNSIDRLRWVALNQSMGSAPVMDDVALGHVSVHSDITSIYDLKDELKAYEGEHAASRVQRLCTEEGVAVSVLAASGVTETAQLGPQLPMTLLDLLNEAAAADMGILYEDRNDLGLRYRTRASMYAQDADLTLEYSAKTISGIEPTEDDDAVRNDVTVSRIGGSSSRVELETGPLSVNDPPDGIGRYADDGVSISVRRDGDLPDQAGWRLHLGTVDEARYPVIGVNLSNAAFTSDAGLSADVRDLDLGDRLVVTNAPSATTSPEDIQQLAQGFTETITPFDWLIDVNCTPAAPWDVAVWDDTSGPGEARYSPDGTTLSAGTGLLLNGVSPGRASTPDTAVLDIVGDLDVRVFATMDDWTPTANQTLAGKWTSGGNQRSYRLQVLPTGALSFAWSPNGIAILSATSTVAPTVVNGEPRWVRAIIDVDNGAAGRTVTFFTGHNGISWVQLGSPVTTAGVTSIFNSTAPLDVGAIDAGVNARLAGRVFAAQVLNLGVGFVANAAFGDQPVGTTEFTDATGLVWTIASPAVIDNSVIVVRTLSGPQWDTADLPYDLMIGGERISVTTVTGTGQSVSSLVHWPAPQAMTVTRAVNGVVKTHASGAEVALFKPGRYAL